MEQIVKFSKRTSKLFVGADTIKNKNFKELEYLVDKLIPRGTLCALVGESDTGKSSLLRQLAFSLAFGDKDFLGHLHLLCCKIISCIDPFFIFKSIEFVSK